MDRGHRVLQLRICGRVQGVGYRWSMAQEAQRLGVVGWVRNRSDGTVQALVSGPPAALQAMVAWARRGPALAVVESVEVLEGQGHFDGFAQRPTE